MLTRLRNYFLAGILVTAPISITIWIAWGFIDFVDSRVRPLIPPKWIPDAYLPFSVPGIGLLFVIAALTLVGMIAAGFVGRMVMRQGERLMAQVPVLRSIYAATKQIFETVLAQRSQAFRQVALVEYPNRGTWAIGFVTGTVVGEVQRRTSDKVIAVFVPATPNPTTGFLLFLPEQDVHVLDLTVEQGLKLVVSGGIVVPPPGSHPTQTEIPLPPPPKPVKRRVGLLTRLRNYLLAGILVTAPISITVWLAWQFISFVDNRVTPLIPQTWNPETYLPIGVPGLGVVVMVVLLTLIGMFTAGFIGRSAMRASEWVVNRLPVIRSIYGALKQIVETVLASRSDAFRECVLLQYPRAGSWAIGFVTGKTEGHVQQITDQRVTNVFLPTTPNPTSGFLLFVPATELVPLTMTVEEGLKMVVSGGIVTPPDRGAAAGRRASGGDNAGPVDGEFGGDIGRAVRRIAEGG